MFLKRLDLQSAQDLDLAIGVALRLPAYSLECFGRLPTRESAEQMLGTRPEHCTAEQITWHAAFDHEQVLGIVQTARHFPDPHSACILALLVDPAHQRHHVACHIVERLSRQARQWGGVQRWCLSVLASNERALRFWHHCGFDLVSTDVPVAGFTAALHNLRRQIKAKPACQHGRVAVNDAQAVRAQNLMARIR